MEFRPRMSALLDQTKDPCRLLQLVFPVAPAAGAQRARVLAMCARF